VMGENSTSFFQDEPLRDLLDSALEGLRHYVCAASVNSFQVISTFVDYLLLPRPSQLIPISTDIAPGAASEMMMEFSYQNRPQLCSSSIGSLSTFPAPGCTEAAARNVDFFHMACAKPSPLF